MRPTRFALFFEGFSMFFLENKNIWVIYQSDIVSQRKTDLQNLLKRKVRISIGTSIFRTRRIVFSSFNYSLNASGRLTFKNVFSRFQHLLVSGFHVFQTQKHPWLRNTPTCIDFEVIELSVSFTLLIYLVMDSACLRPFRWSVIHVKDTIFLFLVRRTDVLSHVVYARRGFKPVSSKHILNISENPSNANARLPPQNRHILQILCCFRGNLDRSSPFITRESKIFANMKCIHEPNLVVCDQIWSYNMQLKPSLACKKHCFHSDDTVFTKGTIIYKHIKYKEITKNKIY